MPVGDGLRKAFAPRRLPKCFVTRRDFEKGQRAMQNHVTAQASRVIEMLSRVIEMSQQRAEGLSAKRPRLPQEEEGASGRSKASRRHAARGEEHAAQHGAAEEAGRLCQSARRREARRPQPVVEISESWPWEDAQRPREDRGGWSSEEEETKRPPGEARRPLEDAEAGRHEELRSEPSPGAECTSLQHAGGARLTSPPTDEQHFLDTPISVLVGTARRHTFAADTYAGEQPPPIPSSRGIRSDVMEVPSSDDDATAPPLSLPNAAPKA